MGKVLLAGILGGVLMFAWGALAHMGLGLGHVGVQTVSAEHEATLAAALNTCFKEPGLYFFPGIDMDKELTDEDMAAYTAKYQAGPHGLVNYHPVGVGEPMSPGRLLTELGFNILCALLAAIVIAHVPTSVGYGRRVLLVTLFGLYATFDIDASQWNWWSFPTDNFLAQIVFAAGGALSAGLAIARVCRT